MVTNPSPLPSFSGFFQMLWNDILNFFMLLTGRQPISNSPLTANSVSMPNAPSTQVTIGGNFQPIFAPIAPALPVAPKIIPITVAQAVQKAIASESNINPTDLNGWMKNLANWQDTIVVQRRIWFNTGDCGGINAPPLSLGQAVTGYASQGIGVTGSALATIGVAATGPVGLAVLGASVIVGALGTIFSHHASAVARDIRAECTLDPAANNALQVVIDGVLSGQITPEQGITAFQALPDIYLQNAGPAKNNSPYCNAICENLIVLRAICFYWISQFQAM